MFALGRQGRNLANRLFQRNEVKLTNVMAEKTGHAAKGTWVGMGLEERTIEGHLVGIEADARPRLFQAVLQVFFAGDEVERTSLAFVGQDEVDERVEGIFLLLSSDLGNGLAGELL